MSTIFVAFTCEGDRLLINVANILGIQEVRDEKKELGVVVNTPNNDYWIDQPYDQAVGRLQLAGVVVRRVD